MLSHLHADHCIDMTSYIVALRYGPVRPIRRIPVYGPSGTKDRIEAAYDPLARKLGLHELFDFTTPLPGDPVELGPFQVSFAPGEPPRPDLSRSWSTTVIGSSTPATPARATRWSSWRRAPTCCCARRPSAPPTSTSPTCT